MKSIEYVTIHGFPTEKQEKEAIEKKTRLENSGYILTHSSASCLTYEKP